MTRCPRCAGRLRKIGPPAQHGYFLDQLLDCTECDWCGVGTKILADDAPDATPVQLTLELEL